MFVASTRHRAVAALVVLAAAAMISACSGAKFETQATVAADEARSTTAPGATATTPASTAPASAPGPNPVAITGSWDLLFADDFDTLDTAVWEPGWFRRDGFSPSVNLLGVACFHPKQLSASDGLLSFALDEETNPDCRTKDGSQGDYVAGLINTRESFTFTYGYAEARVYFPSDGGPLHNWPAFWHTGFDWPKTGEVDIAEGLSGGNLCSVYHHAGSNGEAVQDRGCVDWTDPGGWHVVGANWQPDKITFYFDGDEVFSTTEGIVDAPHYLVLDYTARRDDDVIVPSVMLVDYVRVWQATPAPG